MCQLVLAIVFLLVLFAVGVWDAVAVFRGKGEETVSAVLRTWALASPLLAIAIGVVLGHLFWPLHIKGD